MPKAKKKTAPEAAQPASETAKPAKRTRAAKGETAPKAPRAGKKNAKAAQPPAEGSAPRIQEKPPQEDAGKKRLFALDIGTRSVIGIVAELGAGGMMRILATKRLEHKTRAMLDGQIHDVPQVADAIQRVRRELEEAIGAPITEAAVAAAGRALYTMTATSEMAVDGIVTQEQQRGLDFAGVQAAQAKLATSHAVGDPMRYYCVGYSIIRYTLDDVPLKMLVGQKGRRAKAEVIATFLPRQVIDSMQSALHAVDLNMTALTLEPIAAINALIPATMRHLNLVLVDIGAGTSDIAITKNGSVIAYGMVPQAGDEITEAISSKFLLDFNAAEEVKRKVARGKGSTFYDILGRKYDLRASEILEPILPNIRRLAEAIAKQILTLNGDEPPLAVMLAGGGALTPKLAAFVAEALSLDGGHVAIRSPESVEDIEEIPQELQQPDAVTPLGILKIASINTLHFLSVYVNDAEYSLFHFRELTVSDALLGAGLELRKLNGRPGLGLMVTVDGKKRLFPGTMGTFAKLAIDGEEVSLDTPICADCHISVTPGEDGTMPEIRLRDVVPAGKSYEVEINGKPHEIPTRVMVNGKPLADDQLLSDGDVVESGALRTVGEALKLSGYPPTGHKIRYRLNDQDAHWSCSPEILLNDEPATISQTVKDGDSIEYNETPPPKIGEVVEGFQPESNIRITYAKEQYTIPTASLVLEVNGRPAGPNTILEDGCDIHCSASERHTPTVSEALLAVEFQPPAASSRVSFQILLNDQPVDFTDPVRNGDTLDVVLTPLDPLRAKKDAASTGEPVDAPDDASSKKNTIDSIISSISRTGEQAQDETRKPQRKLTIADFIRPD